MIGHKNFILCATLIGSLIPVGAQAASFCVAGADLPPQCLYDDITNCRKASTPPATVCVVSPDAILNYVGSSRYCTVSASYSAQCIFSDHSLCEAEAGRSTNLVCIDRYSLREKNSPFRYENRMQN